MSDQRRKANERIEGRCEAMVRYIRGWRCTKPAHRDGLCHIHLRVVSRVPESWHHERNEYGVLVPKAQGALRVRRPS